MSYSFTGKISNHHDGVEYLTGSTSNAEEILGNREFDIVFHFGEYSRIVYSFDDIDIVRNSIIVGTPIILKLCIKWNAKLIYSASSSKFGNNGNDENLSPYAWMKAKMVELIKNYNNWFNLKFEIAYFFNVYGPRQIYEGNYSTVVAIFEKQFHRGEKLTVVSPGTQSRDFTHINDIVEGLLKIMSKNSNYEWFLRSGHNLEIKKLALMFSKDYKIIPERKGERFTSEEFNTDTEDKLNWKPKNNVKDWVEYVKLNSDYKK